MILKSDIAKMEDTLKEYNLYKKFLDKVTPQDLKEARLKELNKNTDSKSSSEAKSQADKSRRSNTFLQYFFLLA